MTELNCMYCKIHVQHVVAYKYIYIKITQPKNALPNQNNSDSYKTML